ncbi:hypothetical protein RAA17_12580 [Komagataeibacter rhaeticus]|nr:hypothetical protein [Komagataeibacter rhaeticus]
MPRLPGARAIGAHVIGPGAVMARWRMGTGRCWAWHSTLVWHRWHGPTRCADAACMRSCRRGRTFSIPSCRPTVSWSALRRSG